MAIRLVSTFTELLALATFVAAVALVLPALCRV
jgi:energy-converting hydrogenase Eha subunit E